MKTIKTIAVISLLNALIILGFILGSHTKDPVVNSGGQGGVVADTITPVTPAATGVPTSATGVPTSVTKAPAKPKPACVVQISGKQYDVSQLRNTHSGGNIFQCGTDMTTIFFNQHNQSLLNGTMAKYLIK